MIIYTGCKTGGHVIPLINLINFNNEKCIYIGYENSLEEKLCKDNPLITFIKLTNNYFNNLNTLKILNKYQISAIISTGGRKSLFGVLYCLKKRIPLYFIEGNIVVGDFIKYFYPFCKKVFTGYNLDKKGKYIYTGLPLTKNKTITAIKYDILILGGGLGSKKLCDLAVKLKDKYNILLISGRYYNEYKTKIDKILDYTTDILKYMKESKVIITRAGAQSCYEIMSLNKPFIIIPSKHTKKDHQVLNAKFLSSNKAAYYFNEDDDINVLYEYLKLLNSDYFVLEQITNQNKLIKKDGCHEILKLIKEDIIGLHKRK